MQKGYMTEEERKQPFSYFTEGFQFETCVDFSLPVKVTPLGEYNKEMLCKAIASVTAHFMLWVHPRLNGFSGVDTIRWNIVKEHKE